IFLFSLIVFFSCNLVFAQIGEAISAKVLGSYSFGNGEITTITDLSGNCLRKTTIHPIGLFNAGEIVGLLKNDYNSLYQVLKGISVLEVYVPLDCLIEGDSEAPQTDLVLPEGTIYTYNYDPITGEPIELFYQLPEGWNIYFGDNISNIAYGGGVKCECIENPAKPSSGSVSGSCLPGITSSGPTCFMSTNRCTGTCLRTFTLTSLNSQIEVDFLMIQAGNGLKGDLGFGLNELLSTDIEPITSYHEWLQLPFLQSETVAFKDTVESFLAKIENVKNLVKDMSYVAVAFKYQGQKFLMDVPFGFVDNDYIYTASPQVREYLCDGSCTGAVCSLQTRPIVHCNACNGCTLSWKDVK
ncbi:MAG: hypothetical protein KJ941_06425, partial [Bacteroidetes bacterium]|nr:hypothetical protein [Bacteroidota bacterium]